MNSEEPITMTSFKKPCPNILNINIKTDTSGIKEYAIFICMLTGNIALADEYVSFKLEAIEVFNKIYDLMNNIAITMIDKREQPLSEKEQSIVNMYKTRVKSYMHVPSLNPRYLDIVHELQDKDIYYEGLSIKDMFKMIKSEVNYAPFMIELELNYETIFDMLCDYEYPAATEEILRDSYNSFHQQYLEKRPSLTKQQLNLVFLYYTFLRHGVYIDVSMHRIPISVCGIRRVFLLMDLDIQYMDYLLF